MEFQTNARVLATAAPGRAEEADVTGQRADKGLSVPSEQEVALHRSAAPATHTECLC